jgi:hypothetical protein
MADTGADTTMATGTDIMQEQVTITITVTIFTGTHFIMAPVILSAHQILQPAAAVPEI